METSSTTSNHWDLKSHVEICIPDNERHLHWSDSFFNVYAPISMPFLVYSSWSGRQVVYQVHTCSDVSDSIKGCANNIWIDRVLGDLLESCCGRSLSLVGTSIANHSLCICSLCLCSAVGSSGYYVCLCVCPYIRGIHFSADVSGCICFVIPVVYLSENVCLCVCPYIHVF